MNNTEKLLPCPFCGSAHVVMEQYKADGLRIICKGCATKREQRTMRRSMDWLHEVMVTDWNTRTTPPCLHQIQEPSAAEQAAWHAGLDEGRAQAAPAAVVVLDERAAFEQWLGVKPCGAAHDFGWSAWKARAALAATPAQSMVLPEPDGVANLPYFSYDSDSGVEFHETEAEAIKACESALGYYREESPDGWPDEVESLKWGLVLGRSVQCDVQPIEDHPDFTETCDYQLKPYTLLATATGLPAQAIAEKAAKYDHLLPYLCKTCGGYGLLDRRCQDDPLGSEPCPDCNAAPQAQADARDADGKAFRTAARLGLTLRFYGNCAQSGAPGTPSAYEVIHGQDSAAAMREAIQRADAAIAQAAQQGGE